MPFRMGATTSSDSVEPVELVSVDCSEVPPLAELSSGECSLSQSVIAKVEIWTNSLWRELLRCEISKVSFEVENEPPHRS